MPVARMMAGIINAPLGLGSTGNTASPISSADTVAAKPTPASERSPNDSDMLSIDALQPALERQHRPGAVPAVDLDRRRRIDVREVFRPVARQPLLEWQREPALGSSGDRLRDFGDCTAQ